ncbi:MAG: hypothetical protein HPY51_11690 [Candidatus Omnitrophica bacterium]|nr:hypothetical protein [Candidatus Omnitrophota bacterium]
MMRNPNPTRGERWLTLLIYELAVIFFFIPAGRFHISLIGWYSFSTGYDAYKLFPVLLFTWLAWRIQNLDKPWPQSRFVFPFFLLFLVSLIAAVTSQDFFEAVSEALEILSYFFFLILLLDIPWTPRRIQTVAVGFVIGNLYLASQAWMHYQTLNPALPARVSATFRHPNFLGFYGLLGLTLSFWILNQSRRPRHTFWVGVSIAGLLFAVVTSQSRVALVALGLWLLVLLVLGHGRLRRFAVAGLFAGMMALVFSPDIVARFSAMAYETPAAEQVNRVRIWLHYLEHEIPTLPYFGIGLGPVADTRMNDRLAADPSTASVLSHKWGPHNAYLAWLLGTGLAGMFALFWLLKEILRTAWASDSENRPLWMAGWLAMLLVITVQDPLLYANIPLALIAMLVLTGKTAGKIAGNTTSAFRTEPPPQEDAS